MPTEEGADAIQRVMSERSGWIGARNAAFLAIIRDRGQRIGALLRLQGVNLHKLQDGQVRLILHAKSSREQFELVLPPRAQEHLSAYIAGFNAWARTSRLRERIGFNQEGAFWRGATGGAWKYAGWSKELSEACQEAGVPHVTAHGFRRACATNTVTLVPRSLAALAGNWKTPRRMDDHYVDPSMTRLGWQLANLPASPKSDASRVDAPSLMAVP